MITPEELAQIRERDAAKFCNDGWDQLHRDRRVLLAYVDELLIDRTASVAEMDQLRAQMAHALKELHE